MPQCKIEYTFSWRFFNHSVISKNHHSGQI